VTTSTGVSSTARLSPSRDERLVPYCLVAFGGLAAALLFGQPALVMLAAPFAIALALGLRRTADVEVTTRIAIETDQVLEGDLVSGRIELEWEGTFDAEVIVHRLKGDAVATPGGILSWSLPAASGRVELPIRLQATRWGRHAIGEVWLRLSVPYGLLIWTGRVATGPTLRVLPGSERLTRLLDPSHSRAVLGMHRTRRLGDGHEFAELRPYNPGDRLRDLNWGATARHRRPFVNRHHPELAGDVVIVLDAFVDGSGGSTVALARAARAAWALVSLHLRANDRVGLVGLGGATRWLHPAGGRRAKYELLETLLSIGGEAADRTTTLSPTRVTVPPSALVVALTPLHDRRTVGALQWWRAHGRSVAAIVIDTSDLLGAPTSRSETLARRLWAIELDGRMRELTELGIPVVTATDGGPMAPVVTALRHARRAPALARLR
jgi:uncharacterized protein (DUF58 family)